VAAQLAYSQEGLSAVSKQVSIRLNGAVLKHGDNRPTSYLQHIEVHVLPYSTSDSHL
jgi:hypothetical protein